MPASQTIGIDFGTTNTVVSLTGEAGQAELVRFAADGAHASTFRSALSFHADPDTVSGRKVEGGPWAIEAYLEEPAETRLIQSFKSYAASPLFTETTIIGRRYRFEDMLSAFLLRLRAHAGEQMAEAPPRLIVGRPVRFAAPVPTRPWRSAATKSPSAGWASPMCSTPTSPWRRPSSSPGG